MPTVANMDIAGGCDRLVLFANELLVSQSAAQAEFNEHDRKRAESYLKRLEDFVEMIAEPSDPLDLPKTHPGSYPFAEFPADDKINDIENVDVRDLVRRFKAGYAELAGCQSRDRASGILPADKGRLLALVENARGLITFGSTTIDLPENPSDRPPTTASR